MNRHFARALAAALLLLAALVSLLGCTARVLSAAEQRQLDSLDATGAVRTYFGSADASIQWYLLSEHEKQILSQPNVGRDHELEAGVDDLVVKGGRVVSHASGDPTQYREVQDFTVEYTSRSSSSIGEPPGKRFYYVYAVREPRSGVWRVGSIGTAP